MFQYCQNIKNSYTITNVVPVVYIHNIIGGIIFNLIWNLQARIICGQWWFVPVEYVINKIYKYYRRVL